MGTVDGMRGRRWLLATVVVAVLSGAGGLIAGQFIVSPRQVAAESAPPQPTLITAEVVSERLSTTVIARGQITPSSEVNVGHGALVRSGSTSEPGGDGVLTATFVEVGDRVAAGAVVAEVSGRPMILLPGSRPMYRDIRPGDSGPDVQQLNEALSELGFYRTAVDDRFGPEAQRALRLLYEAVGFDPMPTDGGSGEDEERLDSAQTALKDAEIALREVQQRGRGEGEVAASATELQGAQNAVDAARRALAATESRIGVVAGRTEIVFVPELPAHVTAVSTSVGFAVPEVIVRLTSSVLSAVSVVPTSQGGLLTKGDPAELELPDGSTITGRVHRVGPPKDGEQRVTVRVPSGLDFALAGEDVKVTITTAQSSGAVLAVPPGAISSDAAGRLWVVRVDEDEDLHSVEVETGVHGDGLTEIRPVAAGVGAGDTVLIGR